MALTQWKGLTPFGAQARVLITGAIAAGEGALAQGQVLSLAGDPGSEKWYKYTKPTSVSGEATGLSAENLDDTAVLHMLAKHSVVPGSVDILLNKGNTTDDAEDDGHGRLVKKTSNTNPNVGTIDYLTGLLYIDYTADSAFAAGNMTVTYKYNNQDGKSFPAGILMDYEVDAGAADAAGTIHVLGDCVLEEAVWPAGISLADKARAIRHLNDRGIYGAN